jgi:hypothetical protein
MIEEYKQMEKEVKELLTFYILAVNKCESKMET